MHRAILQAAFPSLAALAASFLLLRVLIRLSGARWNWRRIGKLHRCEAGAVQSLAFVLTLPLFITVVLFIVQVSQLMVGLMVVNYSAFAAARSASVWIPAKGPGEPANRLDESTAQEHGDLMFLEPDLESPKFRRIRTAAVMACAAVSPSREVGPGLESATRSSRLAAESTIRAYGSLVPSSTENTRIRPRLHNKFAFSDRNTRLFLQWRDARRSNGRRNTQAGPTYNPRGHPEVTFHRREAGWQDPVTVYVVHRFALLPGPGRWFARHLLWTRRLPARVRERLANRSSRINAVGTVYTVPITASARITNEGLKSLHPYEHAVE